MYQRERLNNIIEILRQNNYVTVKYLVKALSYSTATINRDLVLLEAKGIITRTYGGVELNKSNHIPPELRYHKMHKEKNRIAREAAKHINNGDTIFIDGSTTCQCMSKYIVGKKDITVITNNISLVSFLALHSVKAICLGGTVTDAPYILSGIEAVETASRYKADKMFFSTNSFDDNCLIGTNSDNYYLLHKTMALQSDKVYFLADHSKHNRPSKRVLFNFSDMHCIISDYIFSKNIKESYPNTFFDMV